MAQVTAELGALIQRTNFELFDFDYQVDDPNFKQEIEERILDFYYDYEIGSVTPDKFKRKFKARFLRIISYYNKLYNTTLLSYNPLINSKMTEALEQLSTTNNTQTMDNTSTGSGESTQDNNTTNGQTTTQNSNTKNSDYPQQPIAGGEFLNGESLTDSDTQTDSTGTSLTTNTVSDSSTLTGTTDLTGTNNTSYEKTIEGLTGTTYQELLQLERETIIRIPNMIIAELKPCFILVH
jgi:hypothetical protein